MSLFWVGVKYPAGFDFLHSVVGEGAIVATILLAWLWWLSDLPATRSEPT